MKVLERMKRAMQTMLIGRNGVDRLSLVMLWAGVFLFAVSAVFSSLILNAISLAIYMLSIFRIFSRNIKKRSAENRYYLQSTSRICQSIVHRRKRFKNRKQYRYFKCPDCKSWLRVPRNAGRVKVTCGHCKHQFSFIA